MLMAEEVLLLLVDDRTGRFLVDSTRLDNVLAGAVLVELVTIDRVGFPPAGGGVKRGRMVVVDRRRRVTRCSMARWPPLPPAGRRSPSS